METAQEGTYRWRPGELLRRQATISDNDTTRDYMDAAACILADLEARNQATREAALPSALCSLTWCDGCLNRRPCITIESGITYEGKDCPIHLCRWCRGHRSRRINERTAKLPPPEGSGERHVLSKATMKPITSLYRCKHCGKTVEREGTKQWRKSFCEKAGKNAHITRVNLQPSNQPASST